MLSIDFLLNPLEDEQYDFLTYLYVMTYQMNVEEDIAVMSIIGVGALTYVYTGSVAEATVALIGTPLAIFSVLFAYVLYLSDGTKG